ncbi:AMP-binding protein [Caballeronia sp. LZ065]|uniref:AMP-binding protein n=1 Tax=Caballeronia sp. LZ065 TaxID=3038571 RepID=UPI0028598ADA|nr:AMP-binding protein [Caballeronia sp. LZ065]MDR5782375.1 AMP-binding protein [Caballeronia sp. LZ065]
MSDTGLDWNGDESRPLAAEQRLLLDGSNARAPLMLAFTLPAGLSRDALLDAFEASCAGHDVFDAEIGPVAGFRGLRWIGTSDSGPRVEWREHDDNTPPRAALQLRWRRIDDTRARLAVTASPLRLDAPSLCAIVGEALERVAGARAERADDRLPYGHLLEWRDALEDDESRPEGVGYWRDWLTRTATDDALALPLRRMRPVQDAPSAPDRVHTILDDTAAAHWSEFCRTHGYRPGDALEAVWWMLLARIGAQPRIAGATVHDCRDDYEPLAGAIGVYRRMLPLMLDIDRHSTLDAVLRQRDALLDAHRQWQECCPAEAGSEALAKFLRASFEYADMPAWAAGDIERFDAAGHPSELALFACAGASGGPLVLSLAYDTSRYDAATARVLLDQYASTLSRLPFDAAATVARLPLGDASVDRPGELRGPVRAFPDATILDAIARHARTTPDAPALRADDLTLGYAQLWSAVEAGARRLRRGGVVPGDVVGIAMPRSGRQVLALLSVMRAGAAYLPIDPGWPDGRRDAIVTSARPRLVLDAFGHEPGEPNGADLPPVADRANAYVMFTSGSTGTPKGVPVTHEALANYAAAVSEAAGFERCRVFAATSTLAADLGNTTLFGAFVTGGCIAVASADDMASAPSFGRFLSSRQVDCVKFVPSHLDALLGDAPACVPATVVLGGEAARPALLAKLRTAMPSVRLFNHYGPTETTVGVLVHEVPLDASFDGDPGMALPLTHVLANNRVRVVDEDGKPAPAGAAGELQVGGRQLTPGYLGAANPDAFVTEAATGERFYATGDFVLRLPSGELRWLGRTDDQVKIRGHRIEPGEVEAACRSLPDVAQAVVMPIGEASSRMLAAWCVPASGAQLDVQTLRHALSQVLPDAWVPAHVMIAAALPRLANGKIDRRALPLPEQAAATGVTPASGIETVLARTMAELLGRAQIGVTDDFFALGGDSLLVIRLVSRVAERLRVEMLPGLVFAHPNVRALATALQASQVDPDALERLAQARLKLDAMTPEARAAMLEQARRQAHGKASAAR